MGLILHSFAVPPSPVTVPESSITLPESAPHFRDEFAVDSPLQRRVNCEPDFLRFRQVSAKPTNPADDRQPVERR